MIRRVVQRPRAIDDVREIVAYIAADSPDAAARFFAHYRRSVEGLENLSSRGRRYAPEASELGDVRVLAVPGFRNHLVFFRVDADTVEVLRVLHGKRDIMAALEGTD